MSRAAAPGCRHGGRARGTRGSDRRAREPVPAAAAWRGDRPRPWGDGGPPTAMRRWTPVRNRLTATRPAVQPAFAVPAGSGVRNSARFGNEHRRRPGRARRGGTQGAREVLPGRARPCGRAGLRRAAQGLERLDRPLPRGHRALRGRAGHSVRTQVRPTDRLRGRGPRRWPQLPRPIGLRRRHCHRPRSYEGHPGSTPRLAPRGPRPAFCWGSSTAPRSHSGWPSRRASSRTPGSPGSRLAAASAG
jgi:hypothetical protein